MHQLSLSFLVSSADTSIGRIDKTSLSQQTLMELLIDKIDNKDKICGDVENPNPLTSWNGVQYYFRVRNEWGLWFDSDGNVTVMKFNKLYLQGSIQLEWLPGTTTECSFAHNRLSGTVSLQDLPNGLLCMTLSYNDLTGSVSLDALPDGIKVLSLNHNGFCGETDFQRLPSALKWLDVSFTKLSGTVPLSRSEHVKVDGSDVTVE